jgi:hypothetical protein
MNENIGGVEALIPIFSLNGFTHEFMGSQTNNNLFVTRGHTMSQEVLKFFVSCVVTKSGSYQNLYIIRDKY